MHFFADCVYPKSIPSHRFTPSRPRVPHPSRVFCERVGIGDSTARVIATLRDHHDRGCPTLLASFARGWGLGIPPPELSQRCGTITTEGAPPFSRVCERVGIGDSTARLTATLRNHHNRGCPTLLACLREGGDWGFHRTTYRDAAEPSQPRVPHPSRVFARGWGLGIPPHDLQRRCGTITTEGAPPFSRVCERVGIRRA